MDFEQKYQKDPGMNRVNATMGRPGWDSQQFFKGGVGTKRTTVASPVAHEGIEMDCIIFFTRPPSATRPSVQCFKCEPKLRKICML